MNRITFSTRIVFHAALAIACAPLFGGGCSGTTAASAPDAGVDASTADAAPTGNAFGEPCLKNTDCAAGVCLANGICTKACAAASDCPPAPEWICGAGTCACTPSGAEVCDGRDNDCNGKIDDGATCGQAKLACQSGACTCKPADVCGSDCFDLDGDPKHCGTCTTACISGCVAGKCGTVAQIAAGADHACARFSDGALRCWGTNAYGQLGDGSSMLRVAPVTTAQLSMATRVAAGTNHTCAIVGQSLWCWGDDQSNELVTAPTDVCAQASTPECLFRPTEVTLPSGFVPVDVALGSNHMCVLGQDGTVACAGDGSQGQLGDGMMQSRAALALVPGLDTVKAIGAGVEFTCALLADGTMRCWGLDGSGQFGDGASRGAKPSPVPVPGVTDVVQMATGFAFTCAVTATGSVYCWGASGFGQLGQVPPSSNCGSISPCYGTPIQVPGVANAVQIAGGRAHVCARLATGAVACWGGDDYGQLGYTAPNMCLVFGLVRPCSRTATLVTGIAGAQEVVVGDSFTCVRLAGNDVRCWGRGDGGQLGDAGQATRTAPGAVTW